MSTSAIGAINYDRNGSRRTNWTSSGVTTFVWDNADYLAEETGGAISVQYSTMNGQLVEEDRDGTVTQYVPDTLGSVIKTTNSSGSVTSSTTFWPYGETNASTGTNHSNFGFVGTWGYYTDSGNSSPTPPRIYIRARTYRPDLSRWLTVDPLWPEEQPFTYADSSPITSRDPSGMQGILSSPTYCLCSPKPTIYNLFPKRYNKRLWCYLAACEDYCRSRYNPWSANSSCNGYIACHDINDALPPCTIAQGEVWRICGETYTVGQDLSNGASANLSDYPYPNVQFHIGELPFNWFGTWCCVECKMRKCCSDLQKQEPISRSKMQARWRRCDQ